MSAPSTSASQTEFCDAMSKVHVYSEPPSGCDTPVPICKISAETLDTLNEVSSRLEAGTSNPRKRARQDSPKGTEPRATVKYSDARDPYPEQSKPIYLRLKTLHKKKLSLASTIKVMEGKLAKNLYPSSVDFKFNINSTRNPVLKDAWSRAVRNCKTELTLALIDDIQRTYNRTKATISKDLTELETLLTPDQFQEINDSLSSKFKQMAPVLMEKKQIQFKTTRASTKRRQTQAVRRQGAPVRRPKKDQKLDTIINTLKALLNN